ncbi:FAD-dependent oxidoreductase [Posidoniimonas polymericola]|uniref:FAD-dependent oxidoreductase n=1 Tax=Posidoniimonas polymericola TaxID=2528002 RepID=UPI0018D2B43B|nr:FAD-dependent oxidoreductase [Posidoniimonas polymericola]
MAIPLALCGPAATETIDAGQYDVVICGGSAAALAAAFTAAEEGAKVALIEPTDWIGGQFTSSGVPAVDEAWHRVVDPETKQVAVDVAGIARDPRNMTPFLRDALAEIGNPGRGWVSRYCFLPRVILDSAFVPREHRLRDRLTVFRDTVVKAVATDDASRKITRLTAIQRTPRPGTPSGGYDRRLSEDLAEWYSAKPSDRFEKRVLTFDSQADRGTIFIDATEWGELLALSGASYLIGADNADSPNSSGGVCGQAITYGFVMRFNESPQADHPAYARAPNLGFGSYRDRPDAWEKVWTYRRLLADHDAPSPGDLSLQNWGYHPATDESGNDYPYGYLFLDKKLTARQVSNWRGGVDVAVLAAAERQAFAWHDWFRRAAPSEFDPDCFTIAAEALGTGHGLSKTPYIRDTRRSIGLGDFLLSFEDISGAPPSQTGRRFGDRVALGAYAADIHPLAGCEYSELAHASDRSPLPYYIPYRSLTNRDFDNLLVAGKTMAQTFLANSAVRLHPSEWSSGCAAGAAAAFLAKSGLSTPDGLQQIGVLQEIVSRHTPTDWTID